MTLPNKLTLGRLGLAVGFVMALLLPAQGIIRSHYPLAKTTALFIFIVAGLSDWFDGWYARRHRQETTFGALLDPLADKVLVAAAFICFIEQPNYQGVALVDGWMVLLIVTREFLVTGLRLVAQEQGVVLRAEKLGKHKTISQMVTIIAVLIGMMLVTVALTIWSGIAYFFKNRKLFLQHA